ncbi:TPA: YebF family protein [Serratia liquefaciens]|uniref:YebF family protein n=1 Tax=Serratia liquefaciens TaxID=614 RepID=UPI00370E47CB
MTFNRKFSIIIVVMAVLAIMMLFKQKKSCSDYTQDAVIEAIKNDFINNRMTHWTDDPEYLGTRKPEIIVDQKQISVTDAFLVPFAAKGIRNEKTYFAIYECKNGSIEYSVNKGG